MKMNVLDQLPGCDAVVAQDVVRLSTHRRNNRLADLADAVADADKHIGRTLMQSAEVRFGNYQSVAIADGADIQKSQDQIVLPYPYTGNLARRNRTEYTVAIAHWLRRRHAVVNRQPSCPFGVRISSCRLWPQRNLPGLPIAAEPTGHYHQASFWQV